MTDLGRLWVWRDPGLARSLGWYVAVTANRRPAKFRITAVIPASLPLTGAPGPALWEEVARRPSADELRRAYGRVRALNLQFDTITFEKSAIRFAPAASTS